MKTKALLVLLAVSLLILGYLFAPVANTHMALDTVISIDIKDKSAYQTNKLLRGSFKLCDQYEKAFSRTIADNELDKLNKNKKAVVSNEMLELIQKAVFYSELSDGAFDVSIKPLVELWDIRITQTKTPDDTAIRDALAHVDYKNIVINGNEVTLLNGAEIDFGGIAKGYIGDKIKAYLVNAGCRSAIINLGGNVVTIGDRPDGTPWSVGIQKPFDPQGGLLGTLKITDKSVVTSGNYERYFMLNGELYHHILDPQTGRPADNGLNAVTIVCDRSADADALSTACFVLGLEKGLPLLEGLEGAEGVFVTTNGEAFPTSGINKTGFLKYE